MERVRLNGADIEYDVRGSGEPVVFIHGAIVSDGFVPVIEQAGVAENFRIVHYRRRGYPGSSRALPGMTMQAWAGDCIALLNHLDIASAHVAGHSFGAGIALQTVIDSSGRVRKLALLEPPLLSLVPSGGQFAEWAASVREIYDSGDKLRPRTSS
jgi:pimeloyl-ACP methyl ester carboxylesterase